MSLHIDILKPAQKQIQRAPVEIQKRITVWVNSVLSIGLEATRKQGGNGLHDEPLKGQLAGAGSIRLNKSWRLIYRIEKGEIKILTILSVTPHKY